MRVLRGSVVPDGSGGRRDAAPDDAADFRDVVGRLSHDVRVAIRIWQERRLRLQLVDVRHPLRRRGGIVDAVPSSSLESTTQFSSSSITARLVTPIRHNSNQRPVRTGVQRRARACGPWPEPPRYAPLPGADSRRGSNASVGRCHVSEHLHAVVAGPGPGDADARARRWDFSCLAATSRIRGSPRPAAALLQHEKRTRFGRQAGSAVGGLPVV